MTHTRETVLRDLRQIASERPKGWAYADEVEKLGGDHESAYGYCEYALKGKPACIVGQWLHRYGGVPVRRLSTLAGAFTKKRAGELGLDIEPDAVEALQDAQMKQDNTYTWREAVEYAAKVKP